LPGYDTAAQAYADTLAGLDPFPAAAGSRRLQVIQLPDPDAAEFVTDSMLLLPFKAVVTEEDRLAMVYAVARGEWLFRQPWMTEGLAHYAQALDIENRKGRAAALDYLSAHRAALVEAEKDYAPTNPAAPEGAAAASANSLIQSPDEIYAGSKAMFVWWMLRDLLSAKSLEVGLLGYDPSADREPSYVQRLLQKNTPRDLEWFFDDWVYRDRGLPDFKVESAFVRKTMNDAYIVTVTVENLGRAGAEVPVTLKFPGGEVTRRVEVRGNSQGVVRIETSRPPQEVVVNDGSVPESDTGNNTFHIAQ
jgi:hypothetical protein